MRRGDKAPGEEEPALPGEPRMHRGFERIVSSLYEVDVWEAYERAAAFMRTFDTLASTAASEWVPTMFTNQFFEDLTVPIGAADAFYWHDLPYNPYGWPIVKHGTTRTVKIISQGTATGTGSIYEWEGNKKVGKGRMEILESTSPSSITIKLDFLRPFEAHNTSEFTFLQQGDSTTVTWA